MGMGRTAVVSASEGDAGLGITFEAACLSTFGALTLSESVQASLINGWPRSGNDGDKDPFEQNCIVNARCISGCLRHFSMQCVLVRNRQEMSTVRARICHAHRNILQIINIVAAIYPLARFPAKEASRFCHPGSEP